MIAQRTADFVIVGSGIAGLRAALALASHGRVLILTKAEPAAGSTGFAQGGIAAAVGPDDSADLHAADTTAAGDGLSNEAAVRVLVTEGPQYVRELIEWGARFDRQPDGQLALAREGAHSVRRVLHARDATGREIGRVLAERLRRVGGVEVRDHALAVQVALDQGQTVGVRYLDAGGRLQAVAARAVLLATGGAGQVFQETTNPPVACGDGVTLAFLAGAEVADLEFVQFHPTALDVPGAPRFLLSEALRGEGARLVNDQGEAFVARYDPAGDLAARDRVSRAIVLERRRTGKPVYLTLAHLPAGDVRERFPLVTDLCKRAGLDLATDRIPVGPAAHYLMGGVVTDLDGRTSVPGLFAAGEAACTGVHGANRLASNSLLEGLVFGARAGLAMRQSRETRWPIAATPHAPDRAPDGAPLAIGLETADLRRAMWESAGVFRDRAGLAVLLQRLDPVWQEALAAVEAGRSFTASTWRQFSLLAVGRVIAHAALRREESRGAHSRTDFPATDDLHWKRHVHDRRA